MPELFALTRSSPPLSRMRPTRYGHRRHHPRPRHHPLSHLQALMRHYELSRRDLKSQGCSHSQARTLAIEITASCHPARRRYRLHLAIAALDCRW